MYLKYKQYMIKGKKKGGDLGARLYRKDADAYTLAREFAEYQYGKTKRNTASMEED